MTNSLIHYKRVVIEEVELIESPSNIDAWDDLLTSLRRYHRDYPTDPLHLARLLAGHMRAVIDADLAASITD